MSRPRGNHAAPEAARHYVTEIWCPPADDGIQRLHRPMPEPEPLPEAVAEAEAEL